MAHKKVNVKRHKRGKPNFPPKKSPKPGPKNVTVKKHKRKPPKS